MAFSWLVKLPSATELQEEQPLSPELVKIKQNRDREIAAVFKGEDNRFILIIGPCSAHNVDALCEYTTRLARVQEKVRERLILIPRIYTNKPRTTGMGYKGMLHQPDHLEKPDVVKGIMAIRHMHIRSLSETGLSAADEMLYPTNYPYLEDLLAYVAIGARSVENQQHRLTVSGLDIPVGMKNPTSGDLRVMLDSVFAAQQKHEFVYSGWSVSTDGNDLAHAVVRGSVDRMGHHLPNYHYEDLHKIAVMFEERELKNASLVVDTNHSNSGKHYQEQPRIANEVMRNRQMSPDIKKLVKGLMIESYLKPGAQGPEGTEFGKSITDPCLGWDESERLILDIADMVD